VSPRSESFNSRIKASESIAFECFRVSSELEHSNINALVLSRCHPGRCCATVTPPPFSIDCHRFSPYFHRFYQSVPDFTCSLRQQSKRFASLPTTEPLRLSRHTCTFTRLAVSIQMRPSTIPRDNMAPLTACTDMSSGIGCAPPYSTFALTTICRAEVNESSEFNAFSELNSDHRMGAAKGCTLTTEPNLAEHNGYEVEQCRSDPNDSHSLDQCQDAAHRGCLQPGSDKHEKLSHGSSPTLPSGTDEDIVDYGYSDSDHSDAEASKTARPAVPTGDHQTDRRKFSGHMQSKPRMAKPKRDPIEMEEVQELLRVGASRLESLKMVRYDFPPNVEPTADDSLASREGKACQCLWAQETACPRVGCCAAVRRSAFLVCSSK
jgi:hypothetical protein